MHGTQICDALQRRRLLRFRYKDHLGPTVVEPYVYGENKSGNLVLSAWLVSGETHDLTPPYGACTATTRCEWSTCYRTNSK
jgi:hypothetical protein